ncbi:MAG: aldolase/citrate lyase family protein [Pseudomonadota bacterium]
MAETMIGMLAMGRMGAAIAAELVKAGRSVGYLGAGRSAGTRARAEAAGARDLGSMAQLVAEAQLLISIAPSAAAAEDLAREVAAAAAAHRPVVLDANPLSTARMGRVAGHLSAAGLQMIDGALFGLPPGGARRPVLLVSGETHGMIEPLDGIGFDVVSIGGETGDASFLKLLQCGASKGSNMLLATLATAAAERGLAEAFGALLARVNPDLGARMERSLPWAPADADRWIEEAEEVGAELAAQGQVEAFSRGTVETLRRIARSPLGGETREHRDSTRSWAETAARLTEPPVEVPGLTLTLMTDVLEEGLWGISAGVDRIGPDMEFLGKHERQGGMGTRMSQHDPAILTALRHRKGQSELFARTDPINERSEVDIAALIEHGAESLMLPYFMGAAEVETFVRIVDGRTRVTLLVETAPSLFRLPEILRVAGVDEIHFGLTDLMISTGIGSRYEVLCSDLFARSCEAVHAAGLPVHIAGIAALDDARLPISADLTLARYAELGASGSLVTRAMVGYCGGEAAFQAQIAALRARYTEWGRAGGVARAKALQELRHKMAALRVAGKTVP